MSANMFMLMILLLTSTVLAHHNNYSTAMTYNYMLDGNNVTVAFFPVNDTHIAMKLNCTFPMPPETEDGTKGCVLIAFNPPSTTPSENSWLGSDIFMWTTPQVAADAKIDTAFSKIYDMSAKGLDPEESTSVGYLVPETSNRWTLIKDHGMVTISGNMVTYSGEYVTTFAPEAGQESTDYTFNKNKLIIMGNIYASPNKCQVFDMADSANLNVKGVFSDIRTFNLTSMNTSSTMGSFAWVNKITATVLLITAAVLAMV